MSRIQIVTAADSAFALPLAACVSSLVSSHPESEFDISVMTDRFAFELREQIEAIFPVKWIDVRSELTDGIRLPKYLPVSSAWRLHIADLVPNSWERVIYMDADTITLSTLNPLWDLELNSHVIAAVRDPIIPWFGAPNGPDWTLLNVPATTSYFNAGVLLIDLKSWRESSIGAGASELLREHSLPYGDQCALNTVLAERWQQLPPRFNLQAGHLQRKGTHAWLIEDTEELALAQSQPTVVHFNSSGFGRPWLPSCSHPFTAEWREALQSTPWRNWRASSNRSIAHRLRRKAKTVLRRLEPDVADQIKGADQ